MTTRIPVVALLGLTLVAAWACGAGSSDLSAADAANVLRTSPEFTHRQGSLVGRQLVDVLAVRRIGRSSTEVEFTWRDFPVEPGRTASLRTSMALFRRQSETSWMLASLYKVD
ncbi:MAG: hypothetical protein NTY02_11130 [Acidobacteria bacterium]|nr:hypothetical protein [Acidobacteriota bacterium]